MRKAIDFIKKPLLIISAAVFAIFAVVLIAVSSQSHGKKYEYSETFFGTTMKVTYTFKNSATIEVKTVVAGMSSTEEIKYEIKGDDLYLMEVGSTTWEKAGEIDAFEIELEYIEEDDEGFGTKVEIDLVCKQNKNIKTLSIAMMAVFGVLAAGSAAVLVLDKKGMLKFLFKEEAQAQVAENVAVEVQPDAPIAQEPVAETTEVAPEAPDAEAAPVQEVAPETAPEAPVETETKE